jgi:asparagine synthetase A
MPLIVDAASGVNDCLDRDGSRTPVGFHISNDRDLHPIDAEVVQAATKWKRPRSRSPTCRGRARETRLLQEHPAVFVHGSDGRSRTARRTSSVLRWDPVTRRRHELTSGIHVLD